MTPDNALWLLNVLATEVRTLSDVAAQQKAAIDELKARVKQLETPAELSKPEQLV